MLFRELLEKWGLSGLKISAGFLSAEFKADDPDRVAAWDLYIELLTRVTTQYLHPDHGDEKAALESVHSLFALTRKSLKKHGSGAGALAKVAIPMLNQIVRPFTAKWHKLSKEGAFDKASECVNFRADLSTLQEKLRRYTTALADIAAVEDLTYLEVR